MSFCLLLFHSLPIDASRFVPFIRLLPLRLPLFGVRPDSILISVSFPYRSRSILIFLPFTIHSLPFLFLFPMRSAYSPGIAARCRLIGAGPARSDTIASPGRGNEVGRFITGTADPDRDRSEPREPRSQPGSSGRGGERASVRGRQPPLRPVSRRVIADWEAAPVPTEFLNASVLWFSIRCDMAFIWKCLTAY